jgi:hypothetical protein
MFVTSRSFGLPDSAEAMNEAIWFNLWRNRLWPYRDVQRGDELYWYETSSERIVWRTRISELAAFAYASLDEALARIEAAFVVHVDRAQPYLTGKPDSGFCLAYRVDVIERVDLARPAGVRFSQQGWERGSRPEIARWLRQDPPGPSASGNPDWARDEVVLTLDLFVRSGALGGGPLPGKTSQDVIALSELLGRLPIHPQDHRGQNFRNPTGVWLKLANLRAVDRDLAHDLGEPNASGYPAGMRRYSALDRATFEEFRDRWDDLAVEAAAIRAQLPSASPPAPSRRPAVEEVSIEDQRTETFVAAQTSTGGTRTRAESALVQQYAEWLGTRGLHVVRHLFRADGEARPLVSDAYVPALDLLVEAKANDSRNSIRMAIGQLMDYRRFLNSPRLSVLLPHEPSADHRALLLSVGIGWIYPLSNGTFRDSSRAAPA